MKRRNKLPYIRQEGANDCGAACFSSIAAYYGADIPVELARELCSTGGGGTSFRNLIEGAAAIGLAAEGYRVESLEELIPSKMPLILHVQCQPGEDHCIILSKTVKEDRDYRYHCIDPARGFVRLSRRELEQIWKSRICIYLYPTSRFQPIRLGIRQKFRWMVDLLGGEESHFFNICLMGCVIALFNLLVTLFLQRLIDDFIPDKSLHKLQIGLITLLVLLVAKEYLSRMRLHLIFRQAAIFNRRMFSWFNQKLFSLPVRYFETRSIGDFNIRFQEAQKLQKVVFAIFNTLLIDSLLMLSILLLLFNYDWKLGLGCCFFSPLYVWWFDHRARVLRNKQLRVIKADTRFEQRFITAIITIPVYKLFRKEKWICSDLDQKNQQSQDAAKGYGFSVATITMWAGIVSLPVFVGVLYYCGNKAIVGSLSTGELVSIVGLVSLFYPALNNLALALVPFREAKIAFNRLAEFSLLSMQENTGKPLLERIETIQLDAVHPFAANMADSGKLISFRVKRGELIAIVGKNGVGKTSLLNVLTKIKKVYQGAIWINNRYDLADLSVDSWLQRIAIVPQVVQLMEGSVLENIGFEDAVSDPRRVEQFVESIGLRSIFDRFPQGVHTIIGDGNFAVSGGEKQLIALARALYRKPELLLLDEISAALDPEAEKLVHSLLHAIKPDLLILFVSHRDAGLLATCDRVVALT